MDCPEIAVIVDTSLGQRLIETLRHHLPSANLVIINDPVGIADKSERRIARQKARELLLSRRWDMILSLYQEMILKEEELQTTRMPINVHPSRPEIPGMSYDVGPLLPASASYGWQGATIHFMTTGIDEGQVIRVEEERVAENADYLAVRTRNQELCVRLVDWIAQEIAQTDNTDALEFRLREIAGDAKKCWGEYISARQRDEMLLAQYALDANHPVFRGNKKFQKARHRREAVHSQTT